WDFDSFSKIVLANAEGVKAKQQNRLNYYQKNLDNLRDSLKNYYSGKYEPIYKDLVVKCDSLVKEYDKYFSGSTVELLKLECGPYGYADYLEDLTEIFNSIMLDCDDFKTSTNPEAFYDEKIKNALSEIQYIDSTVMENFSLSENRYKSYKSRVEQEINEMVTKKEEENNKKDLIVKLESNMTERIISVSQFVADKKNRDLVNELYQNGNQEHKLFYDSYLKAYDSQQLVSEFKVLIYMAANDDYKLQRLTNWDEELKYWGNAINKGTE
ncbi:MAG: hypothetical protein JW870_16930, partial [Candidatus Delongbacteria bacterium]|nr:hypothetical protein [Candidatus Delongbacteria bacterium]